MAGGASDTKGGLALRGGAKPRLARGGNGGWSRRAEALFFETLAETCNVAVAAQAAGVRPQRAYERRRGDAAFRRRWGEALAIGYARLELMLLDRALNGIDKLPAAKPGSEGRMRDYSNQLALALLKLHRDSAAAEDAEPGEEELQETRERITAKLRRLLARDAAAGATDE